MKNGGKKKCCVYNFGQCILESSSSLIFCSSSACCSFSFLFCKWRMTLFFLLVLLSLLPTEEMEMIPGSHSSL